MGLKQPYTETETPGEPKNEGGGLGGVVSVPQMAGDGAVIHGAGGQGQEPPSGSLPPLTAHDRKEKNHRLSFRHSGKKNNGLEHS